MNRVHNSIHIEDNLRLWAIVQNLYGNKLDPEVTKHHDSAYCANQEVAHHQAGNAFVQSAGAVILGDGLIRLLPILCK